MKLGRSIIYLAKLKLYSINNTNYM